MTATDNLLAIGAALRLTRFVTQDWLGEWWIVRPLKRWAAPHEAARREEIRRHLAHLVPDEEPAEPVRTILADYDNGNPLSGPGRLVKGLDCPFCVGFWLVLGGLSVAAIVARRPALRGPFRLLAGALAANYVTGHISSRLDS